MVGNINGSRAGDGIVCACLVGIGGHSVTVAQMVLFHQSGLQIPSEIQGRGDAELYDAGLARLFQKLDHPHAGNVELVGYGLLRHIFHIVVPDDFYHEVLFIISRRVEHLATPLLTQKFYNESNVS